MIAENRPIFPEDVIMVAEPQQTGPQQREGEIMRDTEDPLASTLAIAGSRRVDHHLLPCLRCSHALRIGSFLMLTEI